MRSSHTATLFAVTLAFQVTCAQPTTAVANSDPSATLERVVIVQRHGVRPPTKAPEDLAKFAEQPWPQWSVKPGELTEHGAKAVALMGAALKRTYIREGLFADGGCPAGVFVWADSADQRTRASGDAMLKGMGCNKPSDHLPDGSKDAVFSGAEAGLCPADPEKAKVAAEEKLNAVLAARRAEYDKARATMQSILTPNGCGRAEQRECLVGDGTDTVTLGGRGEPRLAGPLNNASGLTENLMLEYAEGKPAGEVGWGRAGGKLDEVLLLHNLYSDVMRRTPALAARRGSPLAQQVLDLLNSRPSSFKGAAPVPADAKFVVFLGHDTNLSNMSGLLDKVWALAGQPDATAPDTALAFERWRRKDGSTFIRVRVFWQTLEELRALAPIKEPNATMLKVCGDKPCTVEDFAARFGKNVATQCLTP